MNEAYSETILEPKKRWGWVGKEPSSIFLDHHNKKCKGFTVFARIAISKHTLEGRCNKCGKLLEEYRWKYGYPSKYALTNHN